MTSPHPTPGRDGATAERDASEVDGDGANGTSDDHGTDAEGAIPDPRVDAAESAALFLCAVLAGGAWALVAGEGTAALSGLVGGGGVGWVLARLRLRFRAVRTSDGLERRRRVDREEWASELSSWEYDPRYDKLLAAALAVVGAASFAAVALLDAPDGVLLRVVIVGHVSLVAALLVYGVSNRE